MMRMRAAMILALAAGAWSTAASAQREPPPAPAEPPTSAAHETAAPSAPEQPQPAPSEQPEGAAPASESGEQAPTPSPEAEPPPPPAPPPRQFEGQVGANGSAPNYEEDFNKDDKAGAPASEGSGFPAFSIRIDPFNWLLEGRLGIELEVVAYKFISVEAVPVFVANTRPPVFNFEGRDDPLSLHSRGLGPIAGTSLDAGFWLSGKPLEGYVLRAIFTNYGFKYKATEGGKVIDHVNHTERHLVVLFGSHMRIGFFTLAGGIGLGYELNQQQRCVVNRGGAIWETASSGCPSSHDLQIALDSTASEVANLYGGFHPFYVVGRFSLGVAFD